MADDYGHKETERKLAALEKRIARIYREASEDLQKKIEDYFEALVERDKHQRKLLEAGKITEDQYKQWRLNQIARGERFEALRDAVADRYTNANEVAVSYVNDATPGIYSLNRNYAAYTIEQIGGNVGFTLWDEQTVKRLIVEQPNLMPYYPEKRALKRGFDLAWGRTQITKQVTAGILQGESIGAIANRLQKNIPEMNRASSIRTARTAVTGAQNAGRMDSYAAAEKMGISVRKRWIATKDNRTRHSHAMLDGQTVECNKPFISVLGSKMMFPGDSRNAKAADIYNCRCTMRAVEKEGIEAEPRQMRVRNPETGRNELISEMTYAEWAGWKKDTGSDHLTFSVEKIRSAKTISDIASVMQSFTKKHISLDGMDLDLAKENMEQVLRLGNEYGFRFSEIITTSGRAALGEVRRSGARGEKVSLQYPKKYYKSQAALLEQLRKSAIAGELPRLGRRQIPIYTTTHEFAHTLTEELTSRLYGYGKELDFWDEIENVYAAAKKEKPEELGKYAFSNQNEFLAECFAYAKLSSIPNKYADEVLDIVDKYFKKK